MSAIARRREELVERVTSGGVASGPVGPRAPGFRNLDKLGEGGMGEVWRAVDSVGRQVALKVLKTALLFDEATRRRFLREARALANLEVEGIVEVYEVGVTSDGRPFLSMEHIAGPTLAQHLARTGPIAWEEARPLLLQIAGALGAAHGQGVIHRDLKPSNIMLERGVGGLQAKIIDFGLARDDAHRQESLQTQSGHILGTPAYMSPEQLRGERADARSDVYALGCILYEVLTGRRPFGAGNLEEMFYRHLSQPVPSPEEVIVRSDRRSAVEAVILRALRKRVGNRFQSMEEFAAALVAVQSSAAPVAVPDESTWSIVREDTSTKRRPRTAIAAALALVAVGGWGLGRMMSAEPAPSDAEGAGSSDGSASDPPAAPPVTEEEKQPALEVAVGLGFVCARSMDSAVRCWGSDSRGRLGRGTNGLNVGDNEFPHDSPLLALPRGRELVQLANGSDARHTCVRFAEGGVRCWGYNKSGQLGLGNTNIWGDEPREVVDALHDLPIGPVADVVTGAQTTCAVREDGRAMCWGSGADGVRGHGAVDDLGDDELLDADSLHDVELGGRRVVELALGARHGCALVDDGSVRCWGNNSRGQLGVPDWQWSIGDGIGDGHGRGRVPDDASLRVAGLSDLQIIDVAAGADRTCALAESGVVRCWGDNTNGHLGYDPAAQPGCGVSQDCTVSASSGNIQLGDTRATQVSVGAEHACIVDADAQAWCWGNQVWGRLGDGQSASLPTAALNLPSVAVMPRWVDLGDFDDVAGPDRVQRIAAGDDHTCALLESGGVRCWGHGSSGRLGYGSSDTVGDNETPARYYTRSGVADIPVFWCRRPGPPSRLQRCRVGFAPGEQRLEDRHQRLSARR